MRKPQIGNISSEKLGSLLSFGITSADDAVVESCMDLFAGMSSKESLQLMADLRRKIIDDDAGPLSLQRITKVDHLQVAGNGTFLQVLTSNTSTSDILDEVVNYGGILMQPCFPPETRRTGVALFTSAKMSLATHFGREVSDTIRSAAATVAQNLT